MDLSKDEFSQEEKAAVYRAVYERRDIRKDFLPDEVSKEKLMRILDAGHHAGSVGFMQPWNFIVITEKEIKEKVRTSFLEENKRAAENYTGERRSKYESLKLEGILESPVNICVTCDHERGGKVLGRNTVRETDVYSTSCAVQNMWLAARAEGLGMGWVSILDIPRLRAILSIPDSVTPVAYLCLGYVAEYPVRPMLEEADWEKRIPLKELVYWNSWKSVSAPQS